MTQIERNAACPCGSGKKYKKCCAQGARSTLSRKQLLVGIAAIPAIALLAFLLIRSAPNSPRSASASQRAQGAAATAGLGTSGTAYTEIPGVNLASLTPEQRSKVLQEANTKRCTCSCGYTVAACRHLDTSCQTSLPLAQAMVQAVKGANPPYR